MDFFSNVSLISSFMPSLMEIRRTTRMIIPQPLLWWFLVAIQSHGAQRSKKVLRILLLRPSIGWLRWLPQKFVASFSSLRTTCWTHSSSTFFIFFFNYIGATNLCANQVFHSKMKHIEHDFHFVQDYIVKGELRVSHVPSKYQLAVMP